MIGTLKNVRTATRHTQTRIKAVAYLGLLIAYVAWSASPSQAQTTASTALLKVKITAYLPVETATCMAGSTSTPGMFLATDKGASNNKSTSLPASQGAAGQTGSTTGSTPKPSPFGVSMKIPPGLPNAVIKLPGTTGSTSVSATNPTVDQIIAQQTDYTHARLMVAAAAAIFLNGTPKNADSDDAMCPFYITMGIPLAQTATSASPTRALIPASCLQNPQQECDITLPLKPWKTETGNQQRADVVTLLKALTDATDVLTASEREYQKGL